MMTLTVLSAALVLGFAARAAWRAASRVLSPSAHDYSGPASTLAR